MRQQDEAGAGARNREVLDQVDRDDGAQAQQFVQVALVAQEDSFGVIARQEGDSFAKAVEQLFTGEGSDALEDFAAEQCSRIRAILRG